MTSITVLPTLKFIVTMKRVPCLCLVLCPSPTRLQASEDSTLCCTQTMLLTMLQGIFSKKMSLGACRHGPKQSLVLTVFRLCSILPEREGEEVLIELVQITPSS